MKKFDKQKINLMMSGVCLEKSALSFLIENYGKKFFNDDYVTTTGIMIEMKSGYLTAHINSDSKYKITYNNQNKIQLEYEGKFIPIKIWKPSPFMINCQKNNNGTPLTTFVNVHFDRARINPISGCNNSCAYCSMNETPYKKNSIAEMDEALKEAFKDNRVTHVLISGGSPRPCDLKYLTDVYEYFCKKYPDYDFDVMMTPRGFDSYFDDTQYEPYIKHLKEIGVKGLAINLELYNDELCSKYCKEKSRMGKDRYFKFLSLASKEFGTENVRSGLIVGLESKEDTLKAVTEICKCGCMPMLSPYIPYNGIGGGYPSVDFLIDVYNNTEKILKVYNIPLAPLCKKCKHNTL